MRKKWLVKRNIAKGRNWNTELKHCNDGRFTKDMQTAVSQISQGQRRPMTNKKHNAWLSLGGR